MVDDPRFPPVRPAQLLQPWDHPQQLATGRGNPSFSQRRQLATLGPGGPVVNVASSPAQVPAQWMAEAHRYASFISILAPAGLTSSKVLDEPVSYRNFLGLRNTSTTATMYVSFGVDATSDAWLSLLPGASIAFDTVVPQDDIYVISTVAAQSLAVVYSTVAYPGP